jgi:glycosyltransferase involved in cell wall biosynthesis
MKVSVIVPVGNGERFIEAALESIFFQGDTFPGLELEVIVVDNGSTDSTVDLIRRRFGSSVIMGQEPRRGAAFARNRGIGLTTSPWLAFLDADDLWLPGKLRDQCAAFAAMPGLGMVFCQGEEFSDPPGTFPAVETARGFNHASALLVRREVFDLVGLFPEFRCGEFIAWFGWAQTLGVAAHVVPRVLVRRRIHAANTTRSRQLLTDYAAAMQWLISRRRGHAANENSGR